MKISKSRRLLNTDEGLLTWYKGKKRSKNVWPVPSLQNPVNRT